MINKKITPDIELIATKTKWNKASAVIHMVALSTLVMALLLLFQVIVKALPIVLGDATVHAYESPDSRISMQPVVLAATTAPDRNVAVASQIPVPNDLYFQRQWIFENVQALPLGPSNHATIVAVLDSGIDQQHEDLAGKVIDSINFSESQTASDIVGHGTHIAGIIAANTNNEIGISGIAPNTHLLNVKTAEDSGITWPSTIAKGIRWATDNGASIINIGAWVPTASTELDKAVNYAWSKGVVIIAAAGNNINSIPVYPASYHKVVAVSATDSNNRLCPNSNHGNWTDVFAPGAEIYSTLPGDNYGYKSGTSMATAYVSAIAALALNTVEDDNNNGRLNDEVMTLLKTLLANPNSMVNVNVDHLK